MTVQPRDTPLWDRDFDVDGVPLIAGKVVVRTRLADGVPGRAAPARSTRPAGGIDSGPGNKRKKQL